MIVKWSALSLIAVLLATSSVLAQDMGPRIVKYAEERLGKKVGNGECTALVEEAIKSVGGKSFATLGPVGLNADYVWGKPIATLTPMSTSAKDLKPGDIIQFRNVAFSMSVKRTARDGSWSTKGERTNFAHHTAIIVAVKGNIIAVIQQNAGTNEMTDAQKRVVQTGKIYVGTSATRETIQNVTIDSTYACTAGTMWVYRPIAK